MIDDFQPDLFFGPTDAELVDVIRTVRLHSEAPHIHSNSLFQCLDTGAPFPEAKPAPSATNSIATNPTRITTDSFNSPQTLSRAFAFTLLSLLASLTEPVVPYALHARCASVASRDEAFEVLEALPPASVNVWISVTAFLHFISQDGEGGVDVNGEVEDGGEKADEGGQGGEEEKERRDANTREARLMRLGMLREIYVQKSILTRGLQQPCSILSSCRMTRRRLSQFPPLGGVGSYAFSSSNFG